MQFKKKTGVMPLLNINNKGAGHADWVISMGIFLVYTLALFIIIQPGVEDVFKEDNLLQIVRTNFDNDTNFMLQKILLFVNISNTDTIDVSASDVFSMEMDIPAQTEEDISIKRITIPAASLDFAITVGSPTGLDLEDADLSPPNALPAENYSLYEVYYAAGAYPTPGGIGPGIALPDTVYSFGSAETMDGINKNIIAPDPLTVNFPCATDAEYTALKQKWNYPPNKDFSIYAVAGSSPVYDIADSVPVCAIARPFEQASVFVDEYATWILDEFGNRYPIRVNIKVW